MQVIIPNLNPHKQDITFIPKALQRKYHLHQKAKDLHYKRQLQTHIPTTQNH